MSENKIDSTKLDFRQLLDNEPEWLFEKRKNSWQRYNLMPLPDRVSHLWRYSDPTTFLSDNLQNSVKLPQVESISDRSESKYDIYASLDSDKSSTFVIDDDSKKAGIILADLNSAGNETDELVRKHLGQLISDEFGKIESSNMALWNSGILLYIPENTVVDKPVYLKRTIADQKLYQRLLVIVGTNSSVSIIDEYSSDNDKSSGVLNSINEIYVGDSSKVEIALIQNLNLKSHSYITQRAKTGKDSELKSAIIGTGSKSSKVDLGTVLAGRGSQSKMFGAAIGSDQQHHDHHTLHHHTVPDCYSDIDFKVVLQAKAVSAYTGLIRIDANADNCQAFQENRNLLLDSGTRAESIPELEILTDQVQCSHGATVWPIDPQMIYYLTSRGIGHKEAVNLIVKGFIEKTISQLSEVVREEVKGLIFSKLEA